jgi:hypothetical protein
MYMHIEGAVSSRKNREFPHNIYICPFFSLIWNIVVDVTVL